MMERKYRINPDYYKWHSYFEKEQHLFGFISRPEKEDIHVEENFDKLKKQAIEELGKEFENDLALDSINLSFFIQNTQPYNREIYISEKEKVLSDFYENLKDSHPVSNGVKRDLSVHPGILVLESFFNSTITKGADKAEDLINFYQLGHNKYGQLIKFIAKYSRIILIISRFNLITSIISSMIEVLLWLSEPTEEQKISQRKEILWKQSEQNQTDFEHSILLQINIRKLLYSRNKYFINNAPRSKAELLKKQVKLLIKKNNWVSDTFKLHQEKSQLLNNEDQSFIKKTNTKNSLRINPVVKREGLINRNLDTFLWLIQRCGSPWLKCHWDTDPVVWSTTIEKFNLSNGNRYSYQEDNFILNPATVGYLFEHQLLYHCEKHYFPIDTGKLLNPKNDSKYSEKHYHFNYKKRKLNYNHIVLKSQLNAKKVKKYIEDCKRYKRFDSNNIKLDKLFLKGNKDAVIICFDKATKEVKTSRNTSFNYPILFVKALVFLISDKIIIDCFYKRELIVADVNLPLYNGIHHVRQWIESGNIDIDSYLK